MILKMNFKSDLISIVESYFSKNRIQYETQGGASDFAARYFEMRMRRIDSKPRSVFFSEQIHSSLGGLAHEKTQSNVEKHCRLGEQLLISLTFLEAAEM